MHLIFYDGTCGLCHRSVQLLLKIDKKKIFKFAPLQGSTAKEVLKNVSDKFKGEDSMILLEDFNGDDQKFYFLGKAALRSLWLVGGLWMLVGWISFLPPFLYDWGYRFVAKNRYKFFSKSECQVCLIPDKSQNDRFLP